MCMLTAISLPEEEATKRRMMIQQQLNATKRNGDGTGIFTCTHHWKTELDAAYIVNLADIYQDFKIKKTKDQYLLLGHVRLASAGIKVTVENAHPFNNPDSGLTLAHNGKLTPKVLPEGITKTELNALSDSNVFLNALADEVLKQEKRNIPLAVSKTMESFEGTFALLIADVKEKKMFVVKGKTKELWISHYTEGDSKDSAGYIINTDKPILELGNTMFTNLEKTITGKLYKASTPVKLADNTIYELLPFDIVKVGEVTENFPKPSYTHYPKAKSVSTAKQKSGIASLKQKTNSTDAVDLLLDWLFEYAISADSLDILLQNSLEVSFSEVTEEIAALFMSTIAPRMSMPKVLRAEIRSRFPSGVVTPAFYKDYDLKFPWMLNKSGKLKQALRKYAEEKGNRLN